MCVLMHRLFSVRETNAAGILDDDTLCKVDAQSPYNVILYSIMSIAERNVWSDVTEVVLEQAITNTHIVVFLIFRRPSALAAKGAGRGKSEKIDPFPFPLARALRWAQEKVRRVEQGCIGRGEAEEESSTEPEEGRARDGEERFES